MSFSFAVAIRWVSGWVLAASTAAFVCTACGGEAPDAPVDPNSMGGGGSEITDIDPELLASEAAWTSCGGRLECRAVEVPVDHTDPDGPKLSIAVMRAPRWEGHDFRGVILVNPGGPGASGRPFVEALDARRAIGVLQGFDLVGFDPRGVGGSAAVACGGDRYPSDAFESGGVPELVELFASDARACAESMGPLYDHLGSRDVVSDMDLIRKALREEQLNFLGASYGTRLGALYAEMFPENTRAVVLDGPVQPSADLGELVVSQVNALVAAVQEFIVDCDAAILICPPAVEDVVNALWIHSLDRDAEELFSGFWRSNLTQPTGREDIADFLSVYEFFPEIWDDLIDTAPGGVSSLNGMINQMVHCTDQSAPILSESEITVALADIGARAPAFVTPALAMASCTGWTVANNAVANIRTPDAPPLLLVAGEHDILTPHHFAEEMHAALAGSVLVSSAHYGHGVPLGNNPCIDDILDNYFNQLELPADGTACP